MFHLNHGGHANDHWDNGTHGQWSISGSEGHHILGRDAGMGAGWEGHLSALVEWDEPALFRCISPSDTVNVITREPSLVSGPGNLGAEAGPKGETTVSSMTNTQWPGQNWRKELQVPMLSTP